MYELSARMSTEQPRYRMLMLTSISSNARCSSGVRVPADDERVAGVVMRGRSGDACAHTRSDKQRRRTLRHGRKVEEHVLDARIGEKVRAERFHLLTRRIGLAGRLPPTARTSRRAHARVACQKHTASTTKALEPRSVATG